MKQKKEHYVNNKEFLEAMNVYRSSVEKAKKAKKPKPLVGDYLGSCFLKIANHLSYRPNFINYTFKDDMISDGIENCLQYLDNFDGKKSKNPFAYFTQIIYYAFIRRIIKEKKQTTIKHKLINKSNLDDFTLQPGDEHMKSELKHLMADYLQKNLPLNSQEKIAEEVEKSKKKRKKRTSKNSLVSFFENYEDSATK